MLGTQELDQPVAARDRGSHPRLQLPDHRRRGALERRPRLRAASHRAPRHAPRPQVRREPDVLQRTGADAGQGDGRRVPGARQGPGTRPRRVAEGRRAVRAHARNRHGDPGSGAARRAAARPSMATPSSSCTTPTASPPTSPPTSRASAASSADMAGYERAMQRQRELSQASSKFGMDMSSGVKIDAHDRVPRLRRHLRRRPGHRAAQGRRAGRAARGR